MQRRHARIATQAISLVLVFVVGVLVGQQFCVADPEEPPEPDCPDSSPRVVEYCPPEDDEPPPEDVDVEPDPEPEPRDIASDSEQLPDSPPPVDPELRRQLLGWARDQSSTLEGCPRDMGTTHRFGITLQLDEDAIGDVSINTDGDELDPGLRDCLRERIGQWTLPDEFAPVESDLFFHLTL